MKTELIWITEHSESESLQPGKV